MDAPRVCARADGAKRMDPRAPACIQWQKLQRRLFEGHILILHARHGSWSWPARVGAAADERGGGGCIRVHPARDRRRRVSDQPLQVHRPGAQLME